MTWSMNCFFFVSLRFLDWRNTISQMLPPILLQRSPFSKNAFFRLRHSHSIFKFINLSDPYSTSKCRNLTVWLLFFFHTLLNQSSIWQMMFLFDILRTLQFFWSFSLASYTSFVFLHNKVIIIDQCDTDIILWSSKKSYSYQFGWLTLFFMVEQNESEKERRTRRRYRNFL